MLLLLSSLLSFLSLQVVLLNNPLNALFSLAALYFIMAFLLLVLNMEFLALTLVIIYVGALLILFLFILMLSNIKELVVSNEFSILFKWANFYIIFSLISFITKFNNLLYLSKLQILYDFEYHFIFYHFFQNDADCFIYLYTDFFIWFFLIALLLFISVLSALFLLSTKLSSQT